MAAGKAPARAALRQKVISGVIPSYMGGEVEVFQGAISILGGNSVCLFSYKRCGLDPDANGQETTLRNTTKISIPLD